MSPAAIKVPGLHGEQLALPLLDVRPAWHASQLMAPGSEETVPAPQEVHSGAPLDPWARPGVHGKQAAWPVWFWCVPALQAVHRVALASSPERTKPRGQAVQLAPIEAPNVPAAHDTQDVLPSPGDLPALHASHSVALGLLETFPASQGVHSGAPADPWARPGVHGKQAA